MAPHKLKMGDAFIIPVDQKGRGLNEHILIVISDPNLNQTVVTVNATSYSKSKDQACILSRNDHPNISHKSCIDYRGQGLCDTKDIEKAIENGLVNLLPSFQMRIIKQIHHGAMLSRQIPEECRDLLRRQGWI